MTEISTPANTDQVPIPTAPKKANLLDKKNLPKILVTGAIVLLIIIGVVIVLLPKKASPQVASLQKKADVAAQKADFKESQKLLSQALKIDPNNSQTLSQMINTISLQGNQTGQEIQSLKDAQPYIDTALKSGSQDVNVLISVGYAYETAGDYNNALKYYQQAANEDPKSSAAWFHLGHVLQFLGRNDEAYKDYNTSFQLDPNNPLTLMALAGKNYADGQVGKAFTMYMNAAQIPGVSDQNKADAFAAAANIRRYQDNFIHMDESLEVSKRAVDADPNFSQALASYGNNLFLINKPDEGESYMLKAIAANPRISVNYSDLGIHLRGIKKYQDSINYQKQAIEKASNDNTILMPADRLKMEGYYDYELAKTYSMAGLTVNSVPLLTDAIKLYPGVADLVKKDVQTGYFDEQAGNSAFQALISN